MKYVLILLILTLLCSCNTSGEELVQTPPPIETPNDDNEGTTGEDEENPSVTSNKMEITIGEKQFTATLVESNTVTAFKKMLPLTLTMAELNSNEKYASLPSSLPTAATSAGRINVGDIMLYGSSTLVLFYESFSTSYAYTRVGSVDDVTGLKEALGRGSATITFKLK
ncbi:MAG: cyclophilin-like fold protein [Phocaeicola sp.]